MKILAPNIICSPSKTKSSQNYSIFCLIETFYLYLLRLIIFDANILLNFVIVRARGRELIKYLN